MNLLDILSDAFSFTGIFSFEFFSRNPQTSQLGGWLTELFFLLPPEEYTIQEGYKATVTKTMSDAWVDDFGNDIKVIKLTGSLYSYYVGNIFNSENIPVNTGISGLDEFFKLRYIVSRFRDPNGTDNHSELKSVFPEINALMALIGSSKATYENIGIVYHDYDDNNHYEVIFTNFTMSRSKADPWTINYTIEMKTIREYSGIYSLGLGRVLKKESLSDILTAARDQFYNVIAISQQLSSLPSEISDDWNQVVSFANDMIAGVQSLVDNTITDYTQIITNALNTRDQLVNIAYNITKVIFSDKISESIDSILTKYREEDPNYLITNQNYINVLAGISGMNLALSLVIAIDKFVNNLQKKEISVSDLVLTAEQFEKNIPNNFVASDTVQRGYVYKDSVYYTIQSGDTLSKITRKFYGDYSQYNLILDANGLTTESFINDAIVGQNIMIPQQTVINYTTLTKNLVYTKRLEISTPQERQLQVLGSDLDLDSNREFVVDGTGDFGMVYGQDCYEANIFDRIIYQTNSLNPLHPEWGINLYIGNVPSAVILSKLIDAVTKQVSLDPRTNFCYINKKDVTKIGDTIKINLRYKPYSGSENVLDVGNLLSNASIQT